MNSWKGPTIQLRIKSLFFAKKIFWIFFWISFIEMFPKRYHNQILVHFSKLPVLAYTLVQKSRNNAGSKNISQRYFPTWRTWCYIYVAILCRMLRFVLRERRKDNVLFMYCIVWGHRNFKISLLSSHFLKVVR